jgi:hypothetical protein
MTSLAGTKQEPLPWNQHLPARAAEEKTGDPAPAPAAAAADMHPLDLPADTLDDEPINLDDIPF